MKQNYIDNKKDLYFFILFPIIKNNISRWRREADILTDLKLFEYVLLDKYILNYNEVSSDFYRRKQLKKYYDILSGDVNNIDTKKFDFNKDDSLSFDLEELKKILYSYHSSIDSASQIDKNLCDLEQLRSDLNNKLQELRGHSHIDDMLCPFCSSQFQSFEQLNRSYDNYKSYLTEILSQNAAQLQNLQIELNNSIVRLKKKISDELNGLKIKVDEKLLKKIQELDNRNPFYLLKVDTFKRNIKSYTDITPYQLGDLSFDEFDQQYKKSLTDFRSKLLVDEDFYSLIDINELDSYEKNFNKFISEYPDFDFTLFRVEDNNNQKVSKDTVDSKLEDFKIKFLIWIDITYYNSENSIIDYNDIFSRYFDNKIELLEKISISDLQWKRHYIEKQWILFEKCEKLSKKVEILKKMKKHLEKINEIYIKEVKEFKINIIKQLRIPFFIYSAKMLQNYQKGLGIFLEYEESWKKAIIKIKSNDSMDYDVMNQLNMRELAVASLAFTLSLNTSFTLSEHFKLLIIDDPIKDMDKMNVLSFIEILRHGIIDQYQIILSSYSDSNALFMGYKFVNSNSQVEVNYKNVRDLGL